MHPSISIKGPVCLYVRPSVHPSVRRYVCPSVSIEEKPPKKTISACEMHHITRPGLLVSKPCNKILPVGSLKTLSGSAFNIFSRSSFLFLFFFFFIISVFWYLSCLSMSRSLNSSTCSFIYVNRQNFTTSHNNQGWRKQNLRNFHMRVRISEKKSSLVRPSVCPTVRPSS